MKVGQLLLKVIVFVAASIGSLLLCELGLRLTLDPADYLSVRVVEDDILGAKVARTGDSGFDHWGFRNPSIPTTADIVAIGDSHTYGNTARMSESWPMVLGKLTGESVYNMGLGGYGPNQYLYLLQTKALQLKPRMIICGLYMGDDFENAFSISYGLSHWSYLRRLPLKDAKFYIWDPPASRPSIVKRARVWLSQHSILYQLAFHGLFGGGKIQGEYQIRNASKLYPDLATSLIIPEAHVLEAFRPKSMLSRLDQQSPEIKEGMRITFGLLKEMNDICKANHMQFVVVVIPTKESVFSEYFERNRGLPLSDVLSNLRENDQLARDRLFTFMTKADISYVDALPALKSQAGHELYARTASDMHPSRNGYRVIAETIANCLKRDDPHASGCHIGHGESTQPPAQPAIHTGTNGEMRTNASLR
jgi:hypothetical protein